MARKSTTLQAIQQDFFTHLRAKDTSRFPREIIDTKGYNAARRFHIHRNNIHSSLTNTLAATFPVTQQLVGEAFFFHMAREAALTQPPRHGCLQDYGAEFASFIRGFAPAASLPYLADVARLEWALHRAYWHGDVTPLRMDDIRALPPEQYETFRLQIHPAATLIESPYAIHALWQAHQDGSIGKTSIDVTQGPDRMLVTRVNGESRVSLLSQQEWQFLSACHTPATIDQAAVPVLAQDQECAIDRLLIKHIELCSFVCV